MVTSWPINEAGGVRREDTGHWLMEERPQGTMAALPQFL
jgi:hypothetical protein